MEKSYSSVGDVPDFVEVEATEPTASLSVELRDSVRVVGRVPETKLTLKEARPNGPDCPPVCYQGEARVPYNEA